MRAVELGGFRLRGLPGARRAQPRLGLRHLPRAGLRGVDALVAPTYGPAWKIDLVLGDHPAPPHPDHYRVRIAGWPIATAPMGSSTASPSVSASSGRPASEALLLAVCRAVEQPPAGRRSFLATAGARAGAARLNPQPVEPGHVSGESSKPEVEVLLDAFPPGRLGDHHEAMVEVPPEHDLCRCLAVSAGQFHEQRVPQVAALEGTVTLQDDAPVPEGARRPRVVEERAPGDLVHRRRLPGGLYQLVDLGDAVVADADGPDLTGIAGFDERPPGGGASLAVRRPVHKPEVDKVDVKRPQALVQRPQFVPGLLGRALRGHEDFVAVDAAVAERGADAVLVGSSPSLCRCAGTPAREQPASPRMPPYPPAARSRTPVGVCGPHPGAVPSVPLARCSCDLPSAGDVPRTG